MVADNELAFLTIKVQTLLTTRTRQDILTAVSEGFQAAGNDRAVPGLGMMDPRIEDAPELLEVAEEIRRLTRI